MPATTERFFPKAATGNADTIMLDLEDAVATVGRALARLNLRLIAFERNCAAFRWVLGCLQQQLQAHPYPGPLLAYCMGTSLFVRDKGNCPNRS